MELEHLPCFLVVPIHNTDGMDIINGLYDNDVSEANFCHGLSAFQWTIDNKYYNAEIKICLAIDKHSISPHILKQSEAILLYFDPTENSFIEDLNETLSHIKNCKGDVQLLVCNELPDVHVGQNEVHQWCIDNGWELVELNPNSSSEDEEFIDDFADSFGFTRIKQALHAHTWNNLKMKGEVKPDPWGQMMKIVNLQDRSSCENEHNYEILSSTSSEDQEAQPEEFQLSLDGFENLLSSFGDMKRKAETLPPDERKNYAEKVTLAFWRELGGHEEEIEGLESDSED